ncbi:MAG: hypothetical protein E7Z63_01130 [Thermoplasmata archaeon]|nr:hypothetical protein [Thermoplasmata archaeon]
MVEEPKMRQISGPDKKEIEFARQEKARLKKEKKDLKAAQKEMDNYQRQLKKNKKATVENELREMVANKYGFTGKVKLVGSFAKKGKVPVAPRADVRSYNTASVAPAVYRRIDFGGNPRNISAKNINSDGTVNELYYMNLAVKNPDKFRKDFAHTAERVYPHDMTPSQADRFVRENMKHPNKVDRQGFDCPWDTPVNITFTTREAIARENFSKRKSAKALPPAVPSAPVRGIPRGTARPATLRGTARPRVFGGRTAYNAMLADAEMPSFSRKGRCECERCGTQMLRRMDDGGVVYLRCPKCGLEEDL